MKLTNIANLYNEMKSKQTTRQRFNFEYNKVKADVFFLIDQNPFILLFGIIKKNTYFEVKVEKGFVVSDRMDGKTYSDICKAFDIKYSPDHVFKPSDFFKTFNDKVPQKVSDTHTVKPGDILRYRRDVEESQKVYFWRFYNNIVGNVRLTNLEKTRLLMGEEAYDSCKKFNISTQWTDIPDKDDYDNWKSKLQLMIRG